MNREALKHKLNTLSFEEKVGQLIQLTGNFFSINEDIMDTGPLKKLGLKEDFNSFNVGSVLNITDYQNIYELQKEYLERASHGIPLLFMADIIYGYKSVFPIPLAQTCSWNFELIERSAEIIAKECYDAGLHVTFSPMVDIVRDARWGRVMEAPGEDVFLAKKYAEHMVKGIQGSDKIIDKHHIAACVKHFAAYGAPVAGREYNSVELSEASLFNTYLPSYQAAIDAGVKLVMTAFNTLNGIPATGNKWLNQALLREQYQFEGVLISDYAAVEELKYHGYAKDDADAARKALESTVDIDMKTAIYANELEALAQEDASIMQLINEATMRVLELKNDLGLFEDPYRGLTSESNPTFITEASQAAMMDLGSESVVLLKNNGILPLKAKNIGLVGPYAQEKSVLGFWAITGDEKDACPLDQGMKQHNQEANLGWNLQVAKGTPIIEEKDFYRFGNYANRFTPEEQSPEALLTEAIHVAENAETVVVALGESAYQSGEGGSRANPTLPKHQVSFLKELKKIGKPIVLIVFSGRPLLLEEIIDDVDAILYAWFPGTMAGNILAEILSGQVNPSARLSMTFPKSVGQMPIYYSENSSGRPNGKVEAYHRFASRYLDESNEPLYPFGYGLSYSEVNYHSACLLEDEIQLSITNTGQYPTKETVQLYVHDQAASLVRPVKELRDFQKVSLAPNETKTLHFKMSEEWFSFFDTKGKRCVEEGQFTIYIGKNAADEQVVFDIDKKF